MITESGLRELEATVRRLEQAIEAQNLAATRASRVGVAVGASLGLVIVAFVLTNWLSLREEWTRDQFTRSLAQELREISPTARREIRELGEELLPVYAEEGRRQLLALRPRIRATFESELDLLCRDVLTTGRHRLEDTERRVLRAALATVEESYPELADESRRREIDERLERHAERALAASLVRFEDRFTSRLADVRHALSRLEPRSEQEDPVELQKRFITLWLRLLEEEISEL